MRRRWGGLLLWMGALCTVTPSVFAGTCALCRQALASGGNPGLIQGFYWSILLIAGVPLIIIAIVGMAAWRHLQLRRVSQRLQATGRIGNA